MHLLLRSMARLGLFKGKEVGKFERNLSVWLKTKTTPAPPPREVWDR